MPQQKLDLPPRKAAMPKIVGYPVPEPGIPELKTCEIAVAFGELKGNSDPLTFSIRLQRPHVGTFRRLLIGLRENHVCLNDGKHVDVLADVMRHLLEQVAKAE